MTHPEPASSRSGGAWLLLAMCLANGLTMYTSTMVNVLLPDIAVELGTSDTGQQWVATIYTLFYASMLLPGGALGNRIGRRRAFLIGIAVFVIGSIGCVAAGDFAVLLLARIVQAFGAAILLPQTLSILVNEYADEAARARAVGIWAGVSSLGLAAGPVLGGLILGFADWRWGFVLSVVLGVGGLALAYPVVPRSRHGGSPSAPPIDVPGAALSVVALAALVFGLIESANLGWTSPFILGSLLIAALAVAAFLWLEHRLGARGRHPIMPLGIWRSRRLVAANIGGIAYFFLFYGVLYFLSLALQHHGFSPLITGVAFLPMLVVQAVLGPVAGRAAARFGPERVLIGGLVVAAIGTGLLALLPADAGFLDLAWRLVIVGVGCGFASSPTSTLAVSSVARLHSTTASAVHSMCRQIGATLGIAVLGLIPGSTEFGSGLAWAMAVIAAVLLGAAVAVRMFTRGAVRVAG